MVEKWKRRHQCQDRPLFASRRPSQVDGRERCGERTPPLLRANPCLRCGRLNSRFGSARKRRPSNLRLVVCETRSQGCYSWGQFPWEVEVQKTKRPMSHHSSTPIHPLDPKSRIIRIPPPPVLCLPHQIFPSSRCMKNLRDRMGEVIAFANSTIIFDNIIYWVIRLRVRWAKLRVQV